MVRRILTAFTFVSIAFFAFGQERAPGRVFIERIEVRGAQHVSPRVIVAETALREGNEYSEDDVSAGVARVNRLPFVVSADFAMEKGTQDGRSVLVINVREMKRLSFFVDGRGLFGDSSHRTLDYDFDRPGESNDAAAARLFAGDRGMFHFSMAVRRGRQSFTSRYTAWEIGYTRYNLFGTGTYATFNMRTPVDSVNEGRFTPQAAIGLPLTPSQTVSVEYHDTSFVRETLHLFGSDLKTQLAERVITFAWTYDTTDQPFAPARGTLVRIAPIHQMTDRADFNAIPRSTNFAAYAEHLNTNGVDIAALHYWPLSDVNSVSAGVMAGLATVEDRVHPLSIIHFDDRHPTYQIVQAGYSRSLGTSRLEIEARYRIDQLDLQFGPLNRQQAIEASASWVRSNVWGTLRLGIGYERVTSPNY
jgi:outer membrane protein assembly factor BamA